MTLNDLNIKIFADGADLTEIKKIYTQGMVKGFTTNPSLMKKAGVHDYLSFAHEFIKTVPDLPISFEVFTDNFDTMYQEAITLAQLSPNVMVKIPITNSKGESSVPLIHSLSNEGVNLNITAMFTLEQVEQVLPAFCKNTHNYISIFAGRIANTGIDPEPLMYMAARLCHQIDGVELLWASSREVLNVIQAARCECDIITVTNDILKGLKNLGKDLTQYSLETVQMFVKDSQSLGYSILTKF